MTLVTGPRTITDYQAAWYAHELTRRHAGDSVEKLAGALVDAQVDLNPHQIDAAMFAFRSPLAGGALLADEVGLGKTIEAGLVVSQHWAERKRRILVITPANLRKQWYQELSEKFFLPCTILEAKTYNDAIRRGEFSPFEIETIVICSYQFARAKAADVHRIPWDLVVIDEAHRLRNVYKPTSVIANTLKQALDGKRKLLLTATPLQNSLLELFGLVSFIDDYAFGDLASFREQYTSVKQQQVFDELRERLRAVCYRTLRRQVLPYISYTQRLPLVQEFTPDEAEDRLYHLVSDYLRRGNLQALPASQRALMTLVLRKLLASSTYAIAGALETLTRRLEFKLNGKPADRPLLDEMDEEYDALDETAEEWGDDGDYFAMTPSDRSALATEIDDLKEFTSLALSIGQNAKGAALLTALERAFAEAGRLGAARKAIIFTESRRTQDYLLRLLADSEFNEGIVLFNGSNSDPGSKSIYAAWLERHKGTDRVTGSRTADMRSAIVDYFREEGQIMIATEAGAEGINLQFCSLVVNYDLPWNPQRIEQRIGRCHRYGQRHDVVVVNFLNRNNEADQRVFELLSEKFRLFEGVFGASDEVLGAIESGVDFEKRIAAIYQQCRLPEEIQAAFDALQADLGAEIDEAITRTRQQLLDNFDDEVREKLKIRQSDSVSAIDRTSNLLLALTRHELGDAARWDGRRFNVLRDPFGHGFPIGSYGLPQEEGVAHVYRLGHPLAAAVIASAKAHDLPPATLVFNYDEHEGRVFALEEVRGTAGWLSVTMLSAEGPEQAEDHALIVAIPDGKAPLDWDIAGRLLGLPARVDGPATAKPPAALATCTANQVAEVLGGIERRNGSWYEQELAKLDAWADDRRVSLRRKLKELDGEITTLKRQAKQAGTLPEKLSLQRKATLAESRRDEAESEFRSASREVEKRKLELIDETERRLAHNATQTPLFNVRWRLD